MHNSLINGNRTIYPSSIEHTSHCCAAALFFGLQHCWRKGKNFISVDIYHLPVSLSGYLFIRLSSLSRLNLKTSFSGAGLTNASNFSCSIKHNTSNNWVGYISPCGGGGGSKCRDIPLSWRQWAPWSKREPWGWPTLANDPRSWFGMVLWPFKLPIRAAEECRNVPDYRLRAIWAWGRVHGLALYWHCTSGMNGRTHKHTQTHTACSDNSVPCS